MEKQNPRRGFRTDKARRMALARRICWLALGLCVLIAVIVGLNSLKNRLFRTHADDGRILPNVYIADVSVGGLTEKDACNAVRLALSASYSTDDLVISLPGDTLTLSPADTLARLDVDAAVKAAYSYGRTGTEQQNAQTRREAETKSYSIALLPYLNLDLEYIFNAVTEFCANYSMEMTQPTVELQGTRPSYPQKPSDWNEEEDGPYIPDLDALDHQTLLITLGTPDFILEPQAVYDCILDAYSLHQMTVSYEAPTLTEPDEVDLAAVFAQYCTLPQDAEINSKTFVVTPEVYGYGFDLDAAAALLSQADYGQQVSIRLGFLTPDITQEALVGHLFKDTLAEYTATCDGENSARDTNLKQACEALNGYVIKAGETFSFNQAIGPCTTNRGYTSAPSFTGSTASVLGGGIGQISSALYTCALLADLTVTERHEHPYAVEYVQLGFDAAVSYGTQDLCFVNTGTAPIRIVAELNGSNVTIRLMGTRDDSVGYTIRLENQILATYTPNTILQPMSVDNPQGYTDGHVLQQGISGYDIDTYLCKYDAQTDQLLSSVLVATDHYSKRDTILVHISTPEDTSTDNPNTMEDNM